jgi:hypothetical protein
LLVLSDAAAFFAGVFPDARLRSSLMLRGLDGFAESGAAAGFDSACGAGCPSGLAF